MTKSTSSSRFAIYFLTYSGQQMQPETVSKQINKQILRCRNIWRWNVATKEYDSELY